MTLGLLGFSGVAGRECWRYHAKTITCHQIWCTEGTTGRTDVTILLCPYLYGSEEAPATAKRGLEKKSFSAASISASRFWPRVVGM